MTKKMLFKLVALVLLVGGIAIEPVQAETETRNGRDASGYKEALADQNAMTTKVKGSTGEKVTWADLETAFDNASASWMQVYGDEPFLQARPWALHAVVAMNEMSWMRHSTKVVISMLDARGDQAVHDPSKGYCRAQINIDDKASSPVLRALGGYGSAVSFIAAHELVHCYFDGLSQLDKFPTPEMYKDLGLPPAMATRLRTMLYRPSVADGSMQLLDAYDEALADAGATIALLNYETINADFKFGSALEKVQALRFGSLFKTQRRNTPPEVHQGAFVFKTISNTPAADLNWNTARKLALQSVLTSTFSANVKPRWFELLTKVDDREANNMALTWQLRARRLMKERNSNKDEQAYASAASPALFAMNVPEKDKPHAKDTPAQGQQRWKELAWLDVKTPHNFKLVRPDEEEYNRVLAEHNAKLNKNK